MLLLEIDEIRSAGEEPAVGFDYWEYTVQRQYVHVFLGGGNCAASEQYFSRGSQRLSLYKRRIIEKTVVGHYFVSLGCRDKDLEKKKATDIMGLRCRKFSSYFIGLSG